MTAINDPVREYLKKGNPHFDGATAHECLQAAWGHSGGCGVALSEFADKLRLYGFRPDQIKAGVYRLVLPDRPSR